MDAQLSFENELYRKKLSLSPQKSRIVRLAVVGEPDGVGQVGTYTRSRIIYKQLDM